MLQTTENMLEISLILCLRRNYFSSAVSLAGIHAGVLWTLLYIMKWDLEIGVSCTEVFQANKT